MKKWILIILIFLPGYQFAQGDSVVADSVVEATRVEEQEAASPSEIIGSTSAQNQDDIEECGCIQKENEIGVGQWLLVFLPAGIFIFLAWLLFSKALKNFNFSEALKENELTTITIQNPLYQNSADPSKVRDLPPTIQITANVTVAGTAAAASNTDREYKINEQSASYRSSISRYIALISSLMIIIIAIALSSFFIYHYIRTSCPPQLEGLSTVLIALGLGIVPYAANKVSSAISAPKSDV